MSCVDKGTRVEHSDRKVVEAWIARYHHCSLVPRELRYQDCSLYIWRYEPHGTGTLTRKIIALRKQVESILFAPHAIALMATYGCAEQVTDYDSGRVK